MSLKIHPIYNQYGCIPETGEITHIVKNYLHRGTKSRGGYLSLSVREENDSNQKCYFSHRFI